MHERAEALREIAVRGMGLTQAEADAGVSDEEFVAEFMQDRADNA